jgi:hypothetical protein
MQVTMVINDDSTWSQNQFSIDYKYNTSNKENA